MISIKEIFELPKSIKSAVFVIALNLPFWYLDILILPSKFSGITTGILPIVLVSCLTVLWLSANLLIALIFSADGKPVEANEKREILDELMMPTLFLSVFVSPIITYICYKIGCGLLRKIEISFVWAAALLIIAIIRAMFIFYNQEKIQKKSNRT